MANHIKITQLPDADRAELQRRVASKSLPARDVERARIVLLAADGLAAWEIAERVGCSEPTVSKWRKAYLWRGVHGLEDAVRSGRPRLHGPDKRFEVWWKTQLAPPEELGISHWSSRLMAREVGVDHATVARWWEEWGLKPWLLRTCKLSTDPAFEAKLRDIVALYLDPPEKAIVLCVDEKGQTQALDRTQPMLPVRPGLAAGRTHDYVRHGTTTLFAALEVATGKVVHDCMPRHRNGEFLRFLKKVAKAYPRVRLDIVIDNYSTHKHANVEKWLARNPRIVLHFTPTSGSWLNLVETFFAIITKQSIERGSFTSVKDLIATIDRFISGWNERCEPFVWTKDAEEILAHINRQRTYATVH
jgi:transposase